MPPVGKPVFCNLPFKRLKITETGDVRHCCFQNTFIGNVLETDILELWNSKISEEVRSSIISGRLHKSCQSEACPFMFSKDLNHFSTIEPIITPTAPVYLEIDLPSTHCNIGGINPTPQTACFMCPRASNSFIALPDLTNRIVMRIKHIVEHISVLHVSGIAESFWKGRIFDILDMMNYQQYKEQITVLAYTNGTLFDNELQKKYTDTVKRSHLSFSLDAATEETFVKIRRVKMFHKICDNIRYYVKTKPGTHSCTIYNNLNILNIREASQMVELAANLGVMSLGLSLTVTYNDKVENTLDKVMNKDNESIFSEHEKKAKDTAKKLGVELHVQRPLRFTDEKEGRISLL